MPTDGPLLEVRDVTRRFGGLAALRDLSFSVDEGELVSLIGPNGAGKTTAFNVVAGFLAPTAGTVVYAGRPLGGLAPHERARLGLVRTFQQAAVFGDETALECVVTAQHLRPGPGALQQLVATRAARREREARRERAAELLGFCGLDAWAATPAEDLPYGVQKTLNIAIALAASPRLLMLDEPTAGLNSAETEHTGRLLDEINARGTTVLLVEHDMSVVMGLSDRIVVLDHGVKIAEGATEQVRADPAVIAAYLGEFEDG